MKTNSSTYYSDNLIQTEEQRLYDLLKILNSVPISCAKAFLDCDLHQNEKKFIITDMLHRRKCFISEHKDFITVLPNIKPLPFNADIMGIFLYMTKGTKAQIFKPSNASLGFLVKNNLYEIIYEDDVKKRFAIAQELDDNFRKDDSNINISEIEYLFATKSEDEADRLPKDLIIKNRKMIVSRFAGGKKLDIPNVHEYWG